MRRSISKAAPCSVSDPRTPNHFVTDRSYQRRVVYDIGETNAEPYSTELAVSSSDGRRLWIATPVLKVRKL